MTHNFYGLISEVFKRNVAQPCIEYEGRTWTYGDLQEQTEKTAAALLNHGLKPGDRILVQGGKCPESVAFYLACLQTRCVYVPLNVSYTPREIEYFVEDAEPSLIVLSKPPDSASMYPCSVWTVDDMGRGSLTEIVERSGRDHEIAPTQETDLSAILYTSGTTGRSKGAMLTHRNLRTNAQALIETWQWEENDVLLHALPIYHVHGLFVALHCVLLTGTKMIFHAKFDVERVTRDLLRSTVLMGIPTFYSRLLLQSQFTRDTVANMRLFISGSAPLSEQIFDEFEERTGIRILERYGMSETLMNTSNPLIGERVAGTVGFPLPGVQVRIADDAGIEKPAGEVGQIEVFGPNVFRGYWRMPDKTAEEFRPDGYFKTGDMGFKDKTGRISIVGRLKDVIISGGLNIYPAEIESAINEIQGVSDTAVIGAPHEDFGEGVVAVVVGDRTISLDDLTAYLDGKLARFKHPKALRQIQELPRNTMGKVQKNILRNIFEDTFEHVQT